MVILTGSSITGGSEVMVLDGCDTGFVIGKRSSVTSSSLPSPHARAPKEIKIVNRGTNKIVSFLIFVSFSLVWIRIVFSNNGVCDVPPFIVPPVKLDLLA